MDVDVLVIALAAIGQRHRSELLVLAVPLRSRPARTQTHCGALVVQPNAHFVFVRISWGSVQYDSRGPSVAPFVRLPFILFASILVVVWGKPVR